MAVRRILIRAGRPPHAALSLEAAHAYRGGLGTVSTNSGNLLFQDAVYRTLATPGTELVVDSLATERPGVDQAYIDRINDEFDQVVLPLANAFRPDFVNPLNRLTDAVEKLDIPVVVTGVGGQLEIAADPASAPPEVDEATTRFVRAVLERSESIGVRGEITLQYLTHLGFPADRIDIVGCPSMHLAGPEAVVTKRSEQLGPDARLAISLTPTVAAMRAILEANHQRHPNLTYLAQDSETLGLLLWGQEFASPPGMPGSVDHYLYQEDKIRYFVDPKPWLDFLAGCDFAFGSRIHGCMAALMAGTPAFLLAHDSRTLELAKFHRIPFETIPAEPRPEDAARYDAAELHARTDLTEFNRARAGNHAAWLAFLDRNHLSHTWNQPNPDYEARLAETRYSPAARPITSATREELTSRITWLHQGVQDGDRLRTHGAYQPEFIPEKARQLNTADTFRRQQERITGLRTRLREQESQLRQLSRQVEKQGRQIAALLAPRPNLAKRVVRKLRAMGSGPTTKPAG